MEIVKTALIGLILVSLLALNMSMLTKSHDSKISLKFLNQASADEELEEVVITCSSGGQGTCYQSVPGDLYECNPFEEDEECYYDCDIWCEFSGSPSSCCDIHLACDRLL